MVLSNLSVSDVSIYFVWLSTLLVVRDELEHLWRAISCCRLNRSPHFSHLNGSFARSATVILLLTVPQFGIRLLCRFKSCGRLNCFPHRSQDICKASLSTAVILRLFVICSIVVVIIYTHTHTHTHTHLLCLFVCVCVCARARACVCRCYLAKLCMSRWSTDG